MGVCDSGCTRVDMMEERPGVVSRGKGEKGLAERYSGKGLLDSGEDSKEEVRKEALTPVLLSVTLTFGAAFSQRHSRSLTQGRC